MKFSIKDFFTADLVTFSEETLNGKLHFLCSDEQKLQAYLIHSRKPKFLDFFSKPKP